jgi:hypothetical protein
MSTSNIPSPLAEKRLVTAAAEYARHGWHVFPCAPRGKAPLIPRGFHRATCDPDTVRDWWVGTPAANIGLAPGPTGLVVLDFDGPAAEEIGRTLGCFAEPTLEVATARGCHRYYRHPGFHVGNVAPRPGIDVRADAGYVLVPPSVHPTGAVYRWRVKQVQVAVLPPGVEALLRTGTRTLADAPVVGHVGLIPEGQRNHTLNSLCCTMRRRGFAERSIRLAVHCENEMRCVPSLGAGEVDAIIASSAALVAKVAPDETRPARRPAGSWQAS